MPSDETRALLADHVHLWQSDGVISSETAALLRERFEARTFGVVTVIKYLGVMGGVLAAAGLLGLVGAMADSKLVVALLVLAAGAAFFLAGVRLSLDARGRYGVSSKAVLAVGALALAAGIAVVADAAGANTAAMIVATGLVWLPVVFALAYRFRNIFLLVVAVLGFFHWVGSWNAMAGRSTYSLAVQDPRAMALVALLVAAVGVAHERYWQEATLRFYRVYQALGLLYLNLSLLILGIGAFQEGGRLPWIALGIAAALSQIVAGARLQSGLFTGFGVTFAVLQLYTRYCELFWARLDAAAFFLAGGAVLFGAGVLLERKLPRAEVGL
jgi:hypothetical protein